MIFICNDANPYDLFLYALTLIFVRSTPGNDYQKKCTLNINFDRQY